MRVECSVCASIYKFMKNHIPNTGIIIFEDTLVCSDCCKQLKNITAGKKGRKIEKPHYFLICG